MRLLSNNSIYKNFKMGSIVIFLSFIFLSGVSIYYFISVDSYTSLEEKSSNKLSKNLKSISDINNKTKYILKR